MTKIQYIYIYKYFFKHLTYFFGPNPPCYSDELTLSPEEFSSLLARQPGLLQGFIESQPEGLATALNSCSTGINCDFSFKFLYPSKK